MEPGLAKPDRAGFHHDRYRGAMHQCYHPLQRDPSVMEHFNTGNNRTLFFLRQANDVNRSPTLTVPLSTDQ